MHAIFSRDSAQTNACDVVHGPASMARALNVRANGRLFAQWMHHAFPHECPMPQATGSTSAALRNADLSETEKRVSTVLVCLCVYPLIFLCAHPRPRF